MPLPEQHQFENLLKSITASRPNDLDGFAVEELIPRTVARDESGFVDEREVCDLVQRR